MHNFPRVLALCEMQTDWSRIWTRTTVSIFSDDNDYIMVAHICFTTRSSCYFIMCKPPHYLQNCSSEDVSHLISVGNWYLKQDVKVQKSLPSTVFLVAQQKYRSVYEQMILFTQPLRSGRIWLKVNFFKRSLAGLNSEFSFS